MPQAPATDTLQPKSSSYRRDRTAVAAPIARFVVGIAVVVWFFFLAAHLWRTDSLLWNQGKTAPLGVFSHLLGSFTFSWDNSPPGLLAIAVLALLVYWAIGWLFLRLFDVYFTWLEDAALSLLFGAGLCGLLFEFLGMAHLLSRRPVIGAIVMLAITLVVLGRLRAIQPLEVWDEDGRFALEQRLDRVRKEETIEDPRQRYESTGRKREGWMLLKDAAGLFTARPQSRYALRRLWRRGFFSTLSPSRSPIPLVAWSFGVILVAVITLLTFYHALFYPETYWDSLILYLGYGKMTFLEEGFPFKACAQVGIGLGANYPHLYSTHAAAVAALTGVWSDVPARLFAPVAALAAMLLIYGAALRLWRNRLVAIVCALVFRALPYTIAYSTYASDYALAMLFGAAILFLAVTYLDSPLPGTFVLLTAMPALAMHLNYLMGVLWVVWAATLFLSHWRRPISTLDSAAYGTRSLVGPEAFEDQDREGEPVGDPYFSQAWQTPRVLGLLAKQRFWIVVVLAALFAVTWNVRNWWMTGNPVYAFFPGIFDGVRINEEVLRGAEQEWFENGDGIGRLAATVPELETLANPDDGLTTLTPGQIASSAPPRRTVSDRLDASWMYWIGFDTFKYSGEGNRLERGRWRDRFAHLFLDWEIPDRDRPLAFGAVWVEDGITTPTAESRAGQMKPMPGVAVIHWRHAYKLAPAVVGLALPGFLLWFLAWLWGGVRRVRMASQAPRVRTFDLRARAGCVLGVFVFLFLAYEYLIADLYLYQILPFVVGVSLFAGWLPGLLLDWADGKRRRAEFIILFTVFYILLLLVGLVPGVAMSLMGFKFTGARQFGNEIFTQTNLGVLHHPGMPEEEFWRLQYGEDVDAWNYINEHLRTRRLLTHENRHYVLAPSITLVHLDDWDIQKTYTMISDREKMTLFRDLGIRYYYRIPNEARHPANKKVGLDAWVDTPLMTELKRWGDNVLYRFNWSAAGLPDTEPETLQPLESYEPLER